MARMFNNARVPVGVFVTSGSRQTMQGHGSYTGAGPVACVTDRQAEMLPLIRAAKAARQIDPFRHLDLPPEAPRASTLQATLGARSVFATIIGAVRRAFGEQ